MIISRKIRFIFTSFIIYFIATTYIIKNETQKRRDLIQILQRRIEEQKDVINILHAEWAFLTQPEYIHYLFNQYKKQLGLDTIQKEQVVTIYDILKLPALIKDVSSREEKLIFHSQKKSDKISHKKY